eukprot:scaffold2946_cov294-Pinguiococcus_pyrenoidosus.AAC.3
MMSWQRSRSALAQNQNLMHAAEVRNPGLGRQKVFWFSGIGLQQVLRWDIKYGLCEDAKKNNGGQPKGPRRKIIGD